ncbi:MAG: Chitin synthase, class 5 [Alyxoria varia]|nr:MAG: Chitin synthase, class 5 [Alyxoria varia]
MLISLTVGKVDAGVAVLLTEDKRLIEFPSILLPQDIQSGSIVDVDVSRNFAAEAQARKKFRNLQSQILSEYGTDTPSTPILRCRNATQTSVVLEWDPISLATADLRSLTLYRNGSKAGAIPRPFENTSTKISGLAVDTEYTFSLILRTSAGTYGSEKLVVRTHKMTDLSGITVTPGVMPGPIRESLQGTIERMGAKMIDNVRIDTTHFVCTEERGPSWEKAREMNIPVVVPDWVKGCEREGRIVSVRGYYLNADPKLRQLGPGAALQREDSQQSEASPRQQHPQHMQSENSPNPSRVADTPRTEITPPTPDRPKHGATTADEKEHDEQQSDQEESERNDNEQNEDEDGSLGAVPDSHHSPSLAGTSPNVLGTAEATNARDVSTENSPSSRTSESSADVQDTTSEKSVKKVDSDGSEHDDMPASSGKSDGNFDDVKL